jgi:peptidoglycan hydrolase-like amidase
LDKQAVFFRKEVAGAKQYQADLSSKIAQLSAKQQEIISEKQGTFQTTVGDVPLADDAASRPDYNPGFSPAFAIFSFGAPHFKGMSQYGAYGRAKDGQNVDQILKAYYGGMEIKKDYNLDTKIKVAGYGTMDIETYVKRVYEIPNSWGDNGGFEAMKAQAVAARSYALAWTDQGNGGAICTTEACQVYKNSNKGGKWEEAVNATRGWVLWANGKPVKAWFSSTSGGYQQSYTDNYSGHTTPGLWDTPNGRSGWTSQAYEKKAESPWFYKGWYKSRSGDACGRSHPWLNGEEMADILNAWALVVKSGQSDDRVTPNGGCWGGNPYSISELKDRSSGHGGGFGRVEGVNVSYSDGGYTATVTWQTDKGSVSMSGEDFRKAFNLRSPGRIAVKSALFNVEKK